MKIKNSVIFDSSLDWSKELKTQIHFLAEKLEFDSPSDAVVRLSLTPFDDQYRGSCKITSSVGSFMAEALLPDPALVLNAIENSIQKQLRQWKDARFSQVS